MKVGEGKELLQGYSGELLYSMGKELFRSETKNLITLRSHGKEPSRGVIESALFQVKDWFLKVAEGLPWPGDGTAKNIISWESGRIWVEYGFLDPKIEGYRKRARLEMLKGTPFPLLEALTPEALDSISSMMFANIQVSINLHDKREEFAKKMGKKVCPLGEKERFCKYQSTYSLVEGIPMNIGELVFICNIDNECIKEGE